MMRVVVLFSHPRVSLAVGGIALLSWCMVMCPQMEMQAAAAGHECCPRDKDQSADTKTCSGNLIETKKAVEFASALPVVLGDPVAPPASFATAPTPVTHVAFDSDLYLRNRLLRI